MALSLGRFSKNFLILPAIFLLLLGVGNVIVGELKIAQYAESKFELETLRPTEGPAVPAAATPNGSSANDRAVDRVVQRIQELDARLRFYQLVSFGGKIFVMVSSILFGIAALLWGLGMNASASPENMSRSL